MSSVVLIVVVIGALGGFDAAGRASLSSRLYDEATTIAQHDEESLRGTPVTQVLSTVNQTSTVTMGNEVFKVRHNAVYESDTTQGTPCSASGTSSADYLRTDSYVTWPQLANGGDNSTTPVTASSVIDPPESATLVVHDTDWGGNPISGTSVTVLTQAGSTVASQTTDSNGCAIFTSLSDGTYNVRLSASGYLDNYRASTPVKSATVVTGESTALTFTYAPAGYITATFMTTDPATGNWITSGVAGDTFSVNNSSIVPTGTSYPFYTALPNGPPPSNEYSVSTTSPGLFPFNYTSSSSTLGTQYKAWAGTCSSDDPAVVSSGSYTDPPVTLLPGGSPTVQVDVPPIVIDVYDINGNPVTNTSLPATIPTDVHVTDGCGVTRVYSGSSINAPGAGYTTTQGVLVNPDLPSGTYKICVDAGNNNSSTVTGVISKASTTGTANGLTGSNAVAVSFKNQHSATACSP